LPSRSMARNVWLPDAVHAGGAAQNGGFFGLLSDKYYSLKLLDYWSTTCAQGVERPPAYIDAGVPDTARQHIGTEFSATKVEVPSLGTCDATPRWRRVDECSDLN